MVITTVTITALIIIIVIISGVSVVAKRSPIVHWERNRAGQVEL
jgi:hypothetical protein